MNAQEKDDWQSADPTIHWGGGVSGVSGEGNDRVIHHIEVTSLVGC